MGLYLANGTRVTQSTIDTTPDPDPLVKINDDLFQREPYSATDPNPNGGKYTLFCRAGAVLRQSQIELLFPDAVVDSISPATGPTTGGTVVTIKGRHLDGVTSITFDGAAGTDLSVVSATEVRVTTPSGTAGAADVAITDDGGPVTIAGGFTYTA